jgi:hypothetical protein
MAQRKLRRREAVKAAVKHFQATNGLPARSSISKVIAQEEDSYVVRVCYGRAKPPRRAWYMVRPEEPLVIELPFEQVEQYGERPNR